MQNKIKGKKLVLLVFIGVVIILAGSYTIYRMNTHTNASSQSMPIIMAHRGYFVKAVENTIGSLEAAAVFKPDYVELDVVESADGEMFVIHDNNLKRLAGIDEDIRKMTADQVKAVVLKENGYESHISTLSEFVDRAIQLNQNLNVEIKIYGNESSDYVSNVVKLLQAKQVDKKYLIQSLDWNTVQEVNKIEPEIVAGYIATKKDFNLNDPGIDFISIPAYDVAKDLIGHKELTSKPIYVWTIDAEENIEKVLSQGANGVITNRCNEAIQFRAQLAKTGKIS